MAFTENCSERKRKIMRAADRGPVVISELYFDVVQREFSDVIIVCTKTCLLIPQLPFFATLLSGYFVFQIS